MRQRHQCIRPWLFLLVAGLVAGTLSAQVTTARLEGVVKDQTDAIVPGVTVAATQRGTNITFESISNDRGLYIFPKLPPGVYTVTAELSGFKRSVSQGIRLEVGDTGTYNIKLETGEITETVTVTAQTAAVNTVSTSVGAVVSNRQVEALPLVSRDPMDLFYLQPGTNRSTGGGRVDGLRAQANNVTVEGIGASDPMLTPGAATSTVPVPIEAVGEYRVVVSSAEAEFGRGAGAQVQLVFKSGTNQFHGSVFNFHRNKVLNANSFFNNRQGIARPTFLRNQFGAAVGGPIIKDKAFFHFTYEGTRQKTDSTINALVYTPLAKAGTFRFYTKGANSTSRVDAQGNPVVPASDIGTINMLTIDSSRTGKDPSGLFDKLVGSFPNPNNYDIGDGFNTAGHRFTSNNPFTENQWVVKGDYIINSRHRASVSYADRHADSFGSFLLNGTRGSINLERRPSGIVSLNSAFSPHLLNEFRLGGTARKPTFDNGDPDRFKSEGLVYFNGLGGSVAGRNHPKSIFLPQVFPSPVITIADNVSWIRGNHSLKGGFDIRINRSNVAFGGDHYIPVIETSNSANPANVPALSGLNSSDRARAQQLVNDLTGTLGTIRQDYHALTGTAYAPFSSKYRNWRSREWSFFFQDTWKARPNLTLNLGVRWEVIPPHYEKNNTFAYPAGGVNGIRGISGSGETKLVVLPDGGRSIYDTDWAAFGPNVGFNWDPFSDGKWSISGNYRISYDRTWLVSTLFQDFSQEGMSTTLTLNGTSGQRLTALPSLFNSKTGYFSPGTPLGPKPFNRTGVVTVWDPSWYTPYTGSWSVRIQREVMRNTVLAVSYVGNKATGLPRSYNLNQIELRKNGFLQGFLAAQRNLAANGNPLTGESTGVFGQIYSGMSSSDQSGQRTNISQGNVASVADFIDRTRASSGYLEKAGLPLNFFRLNPQFDDAWILGNVSNASYHAMKLEVSRRFSQGLQFDANYTWGKGLSDYEGGQSQRDQFRDNANQRLDKSYNSIDSTHVFNANFIWEVPVGNGRRWMTSSNAVVDSILGGWQLNGIWHYATGSPFTINSGRNKLTTGDQSTANCTGCKSDLTSNVIRGDTIKALTDAEKALFSDPAVGSAGLVAQRYFRASPFWVFDGSIFKSFWLKFIPGEQGELQLRFEFFKAFNNVNFNNPSSTITSGNFGNITSADGGRIIQVAMKLLF